MTVKCIKPKILKFINMSNSHSSKSEIMLRFPAYNKLSAVAWEKTEIKCFVKILILEFIDVWI